MEALFIVPIVIILGVLTAGALRAHRRLQALRAACGLHQRLAHVVGTIERDPEAPTDVKELASALADRAFDDAFLRSVFDGLLRDMGKRMAGSHSARSVLVEQFGESYVSQLLDAFKTFVRIVAIRGPHCGVFPRFRLTLRHRGRVFPLGYMQSLVEAVRKSANPPAHA